MPSQRLVVCSRQGLSVQRHCFIYNALNSGYTLRHMLRSACSLLALLKAPVCLHALHFMPLNAFLLQELWFRLHIIYACEFSQLLDLVFGRTCPSRPQYSAVAWLYLNPDQSSGYLCVTEQICHAQQHSGWDSAAVVASGAVLPPLCCWL